MSSEPRRIAKDCRTRNFDSPIRQVPIPIGTIVPFGGSKQEAEAQTANGWWICDGRTVSDALSTMNGKATPNLNSQFLMGSSDAASTGGAASLQIPQQTIDSHSTTFGAPSGIAPLGVIVQPENGSYNGQSVHREGIWKSVTVPALPPYYSVIYLIRVR